MMPEQFLPLDRHYHSWTPLLRCLVLAANRNRFGCHKLLPLTFAPSQGRAFPDEFVRNIGGVRILHVTHSRGTSLRATRFSGAAAIVAYADAQTASTNSK